jgi:hypothetical protein
MSTGPEELALSANKAERPRKAQHAWFEEEITKARKLVEPATN